MLNHDAVANLKKKKKIADSDVEAIRKVNFRWWHYNFNLHQQSKWVINYPISNILGGKLFLFNPKWEARLNIKGKEIPKKRGATLTEAEFRIRQ